MQHIKCAACPSDAQCAEAGACLNMLVTCRFRLTSEHAVVTEPCRELPEAPKSVRASGVTGKINAYCEDQLRALGGGLELVTLRKAATLALPLLLADGVNENSARKGVGVWARTRGSPA